MLHDITFTGPQFAGSERVSTQVPPHSVCPLGQPQVLPVQMRPPVQMLPQAPQFALSFVVLTQVEPQAV